MRRRMSSAFGYADKPEGGPDWSLRAQWTFLFPVK
jgi:hypothetical protein